MKRLMAAIAAAVLGVCSVSGATWTDSNGYTWTYVVNGNAAEITGVSPAVESEVIAPSTLGGKSVSAIRQCVFQNCTALTIITLPANLASIGASAFQGCTGLLYLQFPSTLKYIGNQAFYGCKNLSLVIFSGDNALDVGESAFLGCTSLKDVTYNGMSLANWAKSNFATSAANPLYYAKVFYCGHLGGDLKDLSVPSGVTRIGNYAFGGCLLDNVTIPDGVTSIGEGAFSGSDADAVTIQGFSLREIGSYAFSTVNMKSFSVPPGVTTIGEKAFFGCRLLKTVSIPESVTTIGDQAFVFAPETVFVDYGDAERVRTMLEDSLLSTSGITFVEDDLSYGYVTFVIVDSSNPSDSVTFMMRKGTTIESKIFIPSRSGHEFLGWYTAKTGGAKVTATTEVTGDVTYYAQWTPKSYTITFNANGGSVTPAFKMVDYCKTYGTLPTPTWGGHEFLGWFTAKTGGTKVTASTKCVGNSTVYAQWKVKQ